MDRNPTTLIGSNPAHVIALFFEAVKASKTDVFSSKIDVLKLFLLPPESNIQSDPGVNLTNLRTFF